VHFIALKAWKYTRRNCNNGTKYYYHREGTSFTKLEEKKWNERENKERERGK
jgi:hypothetical protein